MSNNVSVEGLVCIIYKGLSKLNNKKANNPIKMDKRHHLKENVRMAGKHRKRGSTSQVRDEGKWKPR